MNKTLKPPFGKIIALQIVLTLTIVSNIIGAAAAIRNFDMFLALNPKLNNALGYVYIMCSLIAVIGCYYLWQLKKAGLYVIAIALLTVIGLDLYAGISIQHMISAAALLILIIIVLIPVRKYLI
ncbi:MAG TPA: hypothetical protein VGK25_10310 [Ignavibacteria bacterium]|jgi:hypothetical protein